MTQDIFGFYLFFASLSVLLFFNDSRIAQDRSRFFALTLLSLYGQTISLYLMEQIPFFVWGFWALLLIGSLFEINSLLCKACRAHQQN